MAMKLNSDITSRVIVLTLCVGIVLMRLLRPDIAFDQYSLGALALAALLAIAPIFGGGRDEGAPKLNAKDVSELKRRVEAAGLLMNESRGAYAALKEMRPSSVALAGIQATLLLRLKALVEQAKLSAEGLDAGGCLKALNAAGVTTNDQFEALDELIRLTAIGARMDSSANEQLMDIAIGVLEMLDGTLA